VSVGVIGGVSLTNSFQSQTVPLFFSDQNPLTGIHYFSPAKDYLVAQR
jgi:hypothetical protein